MNIIQVLKIMHANNRVDLSCYDNCRDCVFKEPDTDSLCGFLSSNDFTLHDGDEQVLTLLPLAKQYSNFDDFLEAHPEALL
jgi:hypothetical protein